MHQGNSKDSYGYFSETSREYVITRPDTPRPWLNYIGNENYCVRFSQTGGGDSFHRYPRANMVTFSHYDDTPEFYDDRPGRWVYLKDMDSGEFWSLNWQPVMKTPQSYLCAHAPGYSRIESMTNDIAGTMRVFVPLDDPVEIWSVTLTNKRETAVNLASFSFVEWFLSDNKCKCMVPFFGNHACYDNENKLIHTWYLKKKRPGQNYDAFMAADFTPDGYELSRKKFLGNYGSYHAPDAIINGKCEGDAVDHEAMVGVLQKNIQLEPGQSFQFNVIIGSIENKQQGIELANKYREKTVVEEKFNEVRKYWEERLSASHVKTPCEDFNQRVNTWLKCQVHHTSLWVRPGGDHGFRDTCQDAENLLPFDAPRCRKLLIDSMKHQWVSGKCVREWPQEPDGNLNTSDYRDSPVWLAYSVCEYLKETEDFAFLDKVVPYLDSGEASVYGHVKRALDCLYADRGEHGFSHIGRGDWNDGFDEVGIGGKGESIWLTIALVRALKEVVKLAEYIGDDATCKDYTCKVEELTQLLNETAWDGNWYIRAYNDEGQILGADSCDEGKIFLLPQAWAMLAGISSDEQNRRMIASIDKLLMLDYGPMTMAPVYTNYQKGIGKIAFYAGMAEAGGVFSHAASFLMAGLCEIGEADRAFDIYQRIVPTNPDNPTRLNASEPYVFSNFYVGPQVKNPRRTLYGWLTATGGWMLKNGLSRVCGVKPVYDGLDIKPNLPSEWDEVEIKRVFRGATFNIEIIRTAKGEGNFVEINGKTGSLPIKNIVPGKEYNIKVKI